MCLSKLLFSPVILPPPESPFRWNKKTRPSTCAPLPSRPPHHQPPLPEATRFNGLKRKRLILPSTLTGISASTGSLAFVWRKGKNSWCFHKTPFFFLSLSTHHTHTHAHAHNQQNGILAKSFESMPPVVGVSPLASCTSSLHRFLFSFSLVPWLPATQIPFVPFARWGLGGGCARGGGVEAAPAQRFDSFLFSPVWLTAAMRDAVTSSAPSPYSCQLIHWGFFCFFPQAGRLSAVHLLTELPKWVPGRNVNQGIWHFAEDLA